uniref:Btz domain-containing protein n=1 Tax=Steinernema glaseri TaxID=37863 RepID=A0A1I8AUR8_9BILA
MRNSLYITCPVVIKRSEKRKTFCATVSRASEVRKVRNSINDVGGRRRMRYCRPPTVATPPPLHMVLYRQSLSTRRCPMEQQIERKRKLSPSAYEGYPPPTQNWGPTGKLSAHGEFGYGRGTDRGRGGYGRGQDRGQGYSRGSGREVNYRGGSDQDSRSGDRDYRREREWEVRADPFDRRHHNRQENRRDGYRQRMDEWDDGSRYGRSDRRHEELRHSMEERGRQLAERRMSSGRHQERDYGSRYGRDDRRHEEPRHSQDERGRSPAGRRMRSRRSDEFPL